MRQIVERSIGHIKGRFRRLRDLHLYNVESITKIILCGCMLHNMCVLSGEELEDFIDPRAEDHPNNYCNVDVNAPDGVALRNALMASLN